MTKETVKKVAIFKPADTAKVDAMVKTSSFDAIKEAQKKANKTIQSGNKAYQVVAVAAIVHFSKHHDITVLRNIIENMPDSLNIKAMQMFFVKYAPVVIDQATAELVYNEEGKYNIGLAMENWWYKAAPPAKVVPFNLDAELANLLKRANNAVKKPKEGDNIDKATLDMVRQLATRNVANILAA